MSDNQITDFIKDTMLFRSKTPYYRNVGVALWVMVVAMTVSIVCDQLNF